MHLDVTHDFRSKSSSYYGDLKAKCVWVSN
nr:MAG TPA: Cas system-associated protein [Bacteriophage sp.]